MFLEVGERGGEGRDVAREGAHRRVAGKGVQGVGPVLDADGAGAVQDEQRPGEEGDTAAATPRSPERWCATGVRGRA